MNEIRNIQQQFFDSLKRGTGEAYLIAKNNPTIDFSKYIIKGVLKNYAYDGQSEDSRAQYIYELISLSDKKEEIRNYIFQGLATESEDTWTLTHLFDLAKIYAQQGDKEAKKAIYNRFLHNPIEGSDWVGFSEILALDGLNGLLFIVEKYGKWLKKHPDDWQDDFIIQYFQEENPQIKVIDELQNASKTNPFIKIYLENIQKTEESRKSTTPKTKKMDNIVDEVLSMPFLLYRRRNELSESEILQIATRLQFEKNKSKQEKLLKVFSNYKFPLDSKLILSFARQRPTSKNRIVEFAIYALKHLKSEEIRAFALSKISKTKHPAIYTSILISNYANGDSKLLSEMVRKFKNEHIIEKLASSYADIYKANKMKECKEPLEELYKKMNCGIHRNALIKILIENEALSDKLSEELKYDSYLDTRNL